MAGREQRTAGTAGTECNSRLGSGGAADRVGTCARRLPFTKQRQALERFCRPCKGRVRHRSVEAQRRTAMSALLLPGVLALTLQCTNSGAAWVTDDKQWYQGGRGPMLARLGFRPAAPDCDSRCPGAFPCCPVGSCSWCQCQVWGLQKVCVCFCVYCGCCVGSWR